MEDTTGPDRGDVLTVRALVMEGNDLGLIFYEYTSIDDVFHSINFQPITEDYTEAEIESVNLDEVLEPLYEPA